MQWNKIAGQIVSVDILVKALESIQAGLGIFCEAEFITLVKGHSAWSVCIPQAA